MCVWKAQTVTTPRTLQPLCDRVHLMSHHVCSRADTTFSVCHAECTNRAPTRHGLSIPVWQVVPATHSQSSSHCAYINPLAYSYFEPLVQEEVDAKRALTLPIESVRDRVGKSAKARSGKAMQKREPDEPPPVLQSTFRGRRLKGRKIELPCDYVGVVLKQSRTAHSDGQHKTWEPLLKFDGFTYVSQSLTALIISDQQRIQTPRCDLRSFVRTIPALASLLLLFTCVDTCIHLSLTHSLTHITNTRTHTHRITLTHVRTTHRYWNLDQLPTTNDPTVQAMEWIKLAESIHTDASPMPRRSPRKTPVKDYSHSGVGEEGSPRMKRSKLDVDG